MMNYGKSTNCHNHHGWLWRLIRWFALLAERTADRILGLTAIGGVAGKNSFAEMTNSAFCRHSD